MKKKEVERQTLIFSIKSPLYVFLLSYTKYKGERVDEDIEIL